jgi:hypothetical protein
LAVVVVAAAATLAGVSQAQQGAPAAPANAVLGGPAQGDPALDHFVCYHVMQATPLPPLGTVKLIDQWSNTAPGGGPLPIQVTVGAAVKLCAPITKYHVYNGALFVYPVTHPTLHLTCYKITEKGTASNPVTSPKTFKSDNQFNPAGSPRTLSTQTLTATTKQTVTSLCLPSWKSLATPVSPGEPLADLDHYKCYKATETEPTGVSIPGLPAQVFWQDQFADPAAGLPQATVLKPTEFCNPTEKLVTINNTTTDTPIKNPSYHLTCFSIRTTANTPPPVFVMNQFANATVGPQQLVLGTPYQLCAPSFKVYPITG